MKRKGYFDWNFTKKINKIDPKKKRKDKQEVEERRNDDIDNNK